MCLNACIKTLYRMWISKKHFLEWMTAEEAEKITKKDLKSYYSYMFSNIILGIIGIVSLFILPKKVDTIFVFLVSILWLIAPIIMCTISKEIKTKNKLEELNKQEKEYVLEIGKKTWQYFKDNLNEENYFLPPDNYQEDRNPKVAKRTSPTNIGLGLLATISSYDLQYENLENTIHLLDKMLNTIYNLQKWNGHLYNWYNLENLQPMLPRYISTVDSGNFVGYLYVTKQFLIQFEKQFAIIETMLSIVEQLIEKTDFSQLYDKEARLFSIGFNIEENSLTNSYYDLLASEARQASFIAIAQKQVPVKHWYNLSRTLTVLNQYKGLISWSGTAFEYLMPNIAMPTYQGSLLEESCQFLLMSQKEYSKKLKIPWGISESAFNLKDLHNNYQYKAFGIPWLGLKRGLADEMVVASYGSILALPEQPKEVIKNLKVLEQQNMYDKYGFYESIDYTPTRLNKTEEYAPVKTYMAHHQGLILLSINNLINQKILPKRFMKNPQIKAVDVLLQERMPENVIITKEEKEKPEKIKYADYENYTIREITKLNSPIQQVNVIANDEYTIVIDEKGRGYSQYKNYYINRFKETDEAEQGIFFYFKNVKNKRIWTSNKMNYLAKPDKYTIQFSPEMNKIIRQDGNIETITKIIACPNDKVELRKVELTNSGLEEETIEITAAFEPVLSPIEQDYSHKTFNNLLLNYEYLEETNTLVINRRKRNSNETPLFLAVNLYTENETIGEIEYEIDQEKFYGRNNFGLPKAIENSSPFTKQIVLTTDPMVAMKRTMKIKPGQTISLNLILSVSEEKEIAIRKVKQFMNCQEIQRNIELAKAKVEAENRYLEINAKQIIVYQKMLNYLLFQNTLKKVQYVNPSHTSTTQLWKYGISGDLPILLLKLSEVEEVEIVQEALKAYEYFKVKNIEIDLVIVNQEKHSYEREIPESIQNAILNSNLAYMQNQKGGIFILEELTKEEVHQLETIANLIINAHAGNIARNLKELEEEYLDNIKEIGEEETPISINNTQIIYGNEKENLKYNNEYGGFSEDGSEYHITLHSYEKLPTVWSHILANKSFGTLVTETMGGYTWQNNSRLNRLTAWSNSPVLDTPSEIIYIQDKETKKFWSLGANPSPDEQQYNITYGFGYAKYKHNSNGITQKLDMFVPMEDDVKIQILQLDNNELKKKKLKLIYYIKPVLGEDEIKSRGYLNLSFHEKSNLLYLENIIQCENKQLKTNLFVSSSEKIKSYTGSKEFFIGKGSLANPDGIHKLELDKQNSLWKNGIIAIELEVELEALESKKIIMMMGATNKLVDCQDISYQYSNMNKVIEEYEKTKKYWKELVGKVQVNTPLESTNIMLNGWLIYQTLACRMWARTGYYQSGGAWGFRDQLQDSLAFLYIEPEITKNQIMKHSSHQFIEGDVEHWWHDETSRGIRTRFSDDRLWLAYVTLEYLKVTGDNSLLEIEVPYLAGETLPEGIDEKYDLYLPSEEKGSIYEHCQKAIQISLQFGENGLPKIGSGDWNDGFSTVGNQNKGESVWLGFFLYQILKEMIPICKQKQDEQLAQQYQEVMEKLKRALNSSGWDGRWYRRAYMDNGDILGSIQNEECRIDSIAQSWATISGAGDNDKKYISMESLENHLVDKENGIIKLLDPPFDKSNLEPGYIKAYTPGTRENGGQYTHGAIWAIIAEAMLGFGNKAAEYYRMINPIEHSRTKEAAKKYKVEPYVIAADVYGQKNLAGHGGWTWYTGSSSWFYYVGIHSILGLTIENKRLSIHPCIPNNWREYTIHYKFGNSVYHILVKNPNAKNTGVTTFTVNQRIIEEQIIDLQADGGVYHIEVTM